MNLKRYFLMFIICISSFMIYTNNVKADSYDIINLPTEYTSRFNVSSLTINSTSAYGGFYIYDLSMAQNVNNAYIRYTFPTNQGVSDYTTLHIPFKIISVSNNNNYYCSSYSDDDTNIAGTITYGDGTWSTVDLANTGSGQICTGSYVNEKEILSISAFLMDDRNAYSSCYVKGIDNSYYLECPISSNWNSFNRVTFVFNKNNINSRFRFYFGQSFAYTKSDSSTLNSINNNTKDIKNSINDSSVDNDSTSSSTNGWASKNASNGTITQLLTLPISLLTNITNSINSSCSSFSLGTLFDTELVLPCINLNDYLGSTLVSIIDILFSGFMIYNIAKKLIKIFNDFTNLKSNQIDEIYGGGNE